MAITRAFCSKRSTCKAESQEWTVSFGLNGDAFEAWASRLPFRAIDKHRDDLFQVEAFFFGQAGLLDEELPDADGYYLKFRRNFATCSISLNNQFR